MPTIWALHLSPSVPLCMLWSLILPNHAYVFYPTGTVPMEVEIDTGEEWQGWVVLGPLGQTCDLVS
jgi:hypothetical protein